MRKGTSVTNTIVTFIGGTCFVLVGLGFVLVGLAFGQEMRPGPLPFLGLGAFCFLFATALLFRRSRKVTRPIIVVVILAAILAANRDFALAAVSWMGALVGAVVLAILMLYLYVRWKDRVSVRALKLARAGDVEGAISFLHEHLQLRGPSAPVYRDLATFYCVQGNWAEALRMVAQAEQLGGQSPQLLNTKGMALWKSGQMPEALAFMEEAVSRAPRDLLVACNYGSLLFDLGHREAAEEELRRAEQLFAGEIMLGDAETRRVRKQSLDQFRKKVTEA